MVEEAVEVETNQEQISEAITMKSLLEAGVHFGCLLYTSDAADE